MLNIKYSCGCIYAHARERDVFFIHGCPDHNTEIVCDRLKEMRDVND